MCFPLAFNHEVFPRADLETSMTCIIVLSQFHKMIHTAGITTVVILPTSYGKAVDEEKALLVRKALLVFLATKTALLLAENWPSAF